MPLIPIFLAATLAGQTAPPAQLDWARLTVLYDNTTAAEGVKGDWGFACLVETPNGKLLFDAGAKPEVLKANVKALETDLSGVDVIVLSHRHWDHVGGLPAVLTPLSAAVVFAGTSFSKELGIDRDEVQVVSVSEPREILPGVWSTGEVDGVVKEQALVLNLADGPVVLTGCAHPGVEQLIQRAKQICGRSPEVVLGGFHLMQSSAEDLQRIIAELRELGIERAGATHCTGDHAIDAFRQAFGDYFLSLGVGAKLSFGAEMPTK
jgi:7,8-dihydropterin-6-yl-methyl-4-(beta-D-ribofuranosyl)aminobenzene 5'-phosphate synthase